MGRASSTNVVNKNKLTSIAEEEKDSIREYSVYDYDEGPNNGSWAGTLPVKQGLYDPANEKDACGVGFAAYDPMMPPFSSGSH